MDSFEFTALKGLALIAVGSIAGFINVLAGGGSLLTLPVMIFLGLPGSMANGTNRIAILCQNISGVAGFARGGIHAPGKGIVYALLALPGACLGAWVGTELSGAVFNRILAVLMILVLLAMARPAVFSGNSRSMPPVLGYGFIIISGFYGGFIQAGVGFILMAALHRGLGHDLLKTNMFKLYIIGVYTIAALCIFAYRGQVHWQAGLCLASGNALGAWIASHTAIRRGETFIRKMFIITVCGMAIALVLRQS